MKNTTESYRAKHTILAVTRLGVLSCALAGVHQAPLLAAMSCAQWTTVCQTGGPGEAVADCFEQVGAFYCQTVWWYDDDHIDTLRSTCEGAGGQFEYLPLHGLALCDASTFVGAVAR